MSTPRLLAKPKASAACADPGCGHKLGAHETNRTGRDETAGARCTIPDCRCGGYRRPAQPSQEGTTR